MSYSQAVLEHAKNTGERAPDFKLVNHLGEVQQLDALRRLGPVVLSFYRGRWCDHCVRELLMLARTLPGIEALNGTVVAISPEAPRQSRRTREKLNLPFEVLSDVSNVIARRYSLVYQLDDDLQTIYQRFGVDLVEHNGDDSFELPVPATYVIDRFGVIRDAFLHADYTQRARPEEILAALGELTVGGGEQQGYA